MAGYSGKPLWGKLGFGADAAVVLIDAPRGWAIPGAPAHAHIAHEEGGRGVEPAAAIVAFFAALAGVRKSLPALAERIFPAGALWVAWPRRAGGHESDIREQDIRELALPLGLVDVKVAALDEHWSGLRLVWRVEHRGAARAEAAGRIAGAVSKPRQVRKARGD
jgi:hypothetical protein